MDGVSLLDYLLYDYITGRFRKPRQFFQRRRDRLFALPGQPERREDSFFFIRGAG